MSPAGRPPEPPLAGEHLRGCAEDTQRPALRPPVPRCALAVPQTQVKSQAAHALRADPLARGSSCGRLLARARKPAPGCPLPHLGPRGSHVPGPPRGPPWPSAVPAGSSCPLPHPSRPGWGWLPCRGVPRAPGTGAPRGRSCSVRPWASGPREPRAGGGRGGKWVSTTGGDDAESSARHEVPGTGAQACPARENSSANYSRLIVLTETSKYSLF